MSDNWMQVCLRQTKGMLFYPFPLSTALNLVDTNMSFFSEFVVLFKLRCLSLHQGWAEEKGESAGKTGLKTLLPRDVLYMWALVKADFICQLVWATGCPDSWSNIILVVLLLLFLFDGILG